MPHSHDRQAGADNTYAAVFDAVRRIPAGRVTTYGRIARLIGRPRAARQVGYAMHRCPSGLPWHRVINAQGRISLPAASTAALAQRRRLEEEGVVFIGGKVDLDRFGWPDRD
ncbi:Putative methyltransferase protein [Salinisphaera shabanensis E1L3A]|uniref:Methyltransferase protein n=1 Tax=Salinisphaera shabanensis E1L3A TaxID=1033802 RepID=U2EJP2_9GAMM|nr:methylated-DNA--[protein]-cysteine S-methyltransferase [Salinisphaera shabanensis]ERJ18230.1 Putative methyltransferase protein [Salinisphaera shabanensis E1L3A]